MSEPTLPPHADAGARLVALADEDLRVRAELAADGSLFAGYHPRMEAVHRHNALALREVIDRIGWPTTSVVGEAGAEAAWLIVQHAIGEPDFQRACLVAITSAVAAGDVPPWHAAMLDDRIRVFEGRRQRYGTQLEPDDRGVLRPCAIEDPDRVEALRAEVGLSPLSEKLAALARQPPEPVPADREAFEREKQAWLVRAGWR